MRVTEEKDRREREALVLSLLPRALEEVFRDLEVCVQYYAASFGPESADIRLEEGGISITVREECNGGWRPGSQVRISTVTTLPGFKVENGGEPVEIEVGILNGDKPFYKRGENFLTGEQLTKLILDRAFFPKLGD